MATFSTLHIFGFGDVQLIQKDSPSITKKASSLTTLQAYVDDVWSKAPSGNVGTKEYHAINTFDGLFADWQPKVKGESGYRVPFANLDQTLLDALIAEMLTPVA